MLFRIFILRVCLFHTKPLRQVHRVATIVADTTCHKVRAWLSKEALMVETTAYMVS